MTEIGEHVGDDAAQRAEGVVGWYGDPESVWSIGVDLTWSVPLDAAALAEGWARACAEHAHLGVVGEVRVVADDTYEAAKPMVLSQAYRHGEPLVRLQLNASGTRLLVVAHHGAVDGLGLLGLAAALTGRPITSAARGIGDRPAGKGFLRRAIGRVWEALTSPPARFPGSGEPGALTEDLHGIAFPARRLGTAGISAAALAAYDAAAGGVAGRRSGSRRPVLMIGASRREGSRLAPDRDTAYFRVRPTPGQRTPEALGALLGSLPPEPAFPETSSGGIGPLVVGLLRSRLGGTCLISNLGIVHADGLLEVRMYPAPSGPQAVALGLASTDQVTTVTLRTRRRDFTAAESSRVWEHLVAALAEPR